MTKEIIVMPPQVADVKALPLISDLQFLEIATSEALNRKMLGVVNDGIRRGFNFTIGSGLKMVMGDNSGKNTACVERDGVLLTIQGQHPVEVTLPAGKESAIVIEGFYKYGVKTKQVDIDSDVDGAKIIVIDSNKTADHHVVLCDVNVPLGATQITEPMISILRRKSAGLDIQSHVDHVNPHNQYVKKVFQVKTVGPMRGGKDFNGDSLTISIDTATTSRTGSVQLIDSYTNTSAVLAPTGNALRAANQRAVDKETAIQSDLNSHKANKANPHTVTKAQVGLGSVPNFPATGATNDASDSKFSTAGAVKKAYDKAVAVESATNGSITAHVNNKSNPHAVTKAQVGLGSVPNYSISDAYNSTGTNFASRTALFNAYTALTNSINSVNAAKVAKSGDRMTGALVIANAGPDPKLKINRTDSDTNIGIEFSGTNDNRSMFGLGTDGHLYYGKEADFTNLGSKLYSTTFKPSKADVGLSAVNNWAATTAVNSTSTTTYATASAVKQAYDLAAGKLAANARSVDSAKLEGKTKAQVVAEARSGLAADSTVSSHVGNKANPHAVTKAQVGLSAVNNWGATSAVNSTSATTYATASAVKLAYDLAAGKMTQATGDGRYAPKSHSHDTLTTKTISDWNATNITNGFIQGESRPNTPISGWVWGLNMQHGNGYGMQIVAGNGGHNYYIRSRDSGGNGSWGKIYTSTSKPSKTDVGLSAVNNWGATSAVNSTSTTTYATASAVKLAYDLAASKITKAQGDSYYLGKTATAESSKANITSYSIAPSDANIINPVAGGFQYHYNIQTGSSNYFPISNNANGVLTFNTHSGEYRAQLGFSSDTKMYFRTNIAGSKTAWGQVYTSVHKPNKNDVGLSAVNNWGATSAVNSASTTTYATASAVKQAYDLAASKLTSNARSVDSAKLEGKTKAQVVAEARSGLAADSTVSSHVGNRANPHAVTKAQVGLSAVNNWGATSAVNSASTTTYATASAVKLAYDLAASKMTQSSSDGRYYPNTGGNLSGPVKMTKHINSGGWGNIMENDGRENAPLITKHLYDTPNPNVTMYAPLVTGQARPQTGRFLGTSFGVFWDGADISSAAICISDINNKDQRSWMYHRNGDASSASGRWLDSSDINCKKNIAPLIKGRESALSKCMQFRAFTFDYLNGGPTNAAGFIAQDVQKVLPEAVVEIIVGDKDSKPTKQLCIHHGGITALQHEAILELKAENETLSTSLQQVKTDLAHLRSKLDRLISK